MLSVIDRRGEFGPTITDSFMFLRDSTPDIERFSSEEVVKDDDIQGISYARDTQTLDHLFVPRGIKGLEKQIVFSRSGDFVLPSFVVYEDSNGYEKLLATVPQGNALVAGNSHAESMRQSQSLTQVQTQMQLVVQTQTPMAAYEAQPIQGYVQTQMSVVSYAQEQAQVMGYAYSDAQEQTSVAGYVQESVYSHSRLESEYQMVSYARVDAQVKQDVQMYVQDHVELRSNVQAQSYEQPQMFVDVRSDIVSSVGSAVGYVSQSIDIVQNSYDSLEKVSLNVDIPVVDAVRYEAPELPKVDVVDLTQTNYDMGANLEVKIDVVAKVDNSSLQVAQVRDYVTPVEMSTIHEFGDSMTTLTQENYALSFIDTKSVEKTDITDDVRVNSDVKEMSNLDSLTMTGSQNAVSANVVLEYVASHRESGAVEQTADEVYLQNTSLDVYIEPALQPTMTTLVPNVFSLDVYVNESLSQKVQAKEESRLELSEVVRDGKVLTGIQTLFEDYVVTEKDVADSSKTYNLTVKNVDTKQDEAYLVGQNSVYAVLDRNLKELGAQNITYELHTLTVEGKIRKAIIVKDTDGTLSKAVGVVGDNIDKLGLAIFIDDEEPGNGTTNLETYELKAGMKLDLAVIDQDTYRGNFSGKEKDFATRCVTSTELVEQNIAQAGLEQNFGLKTVERDGKTLDGILSFVNDYKITKDDFIDGETYAITAFDSQTGEKRIVEIDSRAYLAVLDKKLSQLGANLDYQVVTYAKGGKIIERIEIKGIFEYDKHALEAFDADTRKFVGMLGFLNGREPGDGNIALDEVLVEVGDTIDFTFVDYGGEKRYNGDFVQDGLGSAHGVADIDARAAELGMLEVFAYQDMEIAGREAVGIINNYVVDDIAEHRYMANIVDPSITSTQQEIKANSVAAVIDYMLSENEIGLNMRINQDVFGAKQVTGFYERDLVMDQRFGQGNYDVAAVVNGAIVTDLVNTTVKKGDEIKIAYVKKE